MRSSHRSKSINKIIPEPARSSDVMYFNFDQYKVPIFLFLFTLFFMITISNPALYVNDEWVSANQLNQLYQGHQIIINEGKYGTFINGTPAPYFQQINNKLGYSLMLPLLSLPALAVFGLFGDSFRFLIIIFWTGLGILLLLFIDNNYPQYSKIKSVSWAILGIAGFLLLLALNILNYTIWPFSSATAPKEVAALVFTNACLLSLLVTIIYLIGKTVFKNTQIALFSTFVTIACSSYLFWATNAKDHILVATIFAIVILLFIRYLQDDSFIDCAGCFFTMGILTWARPEVGFSVLLFSAVFLIAYHIYNLRENPDFRLFFKKSLAILFILPGCIPFFINNYIVNGNPVKPTMLVYLSAPAAQITASLPSTSVQQVSTISIPEILNGAANQIFSYYHFAPAKLPGDLFGILFLPPSGNLGFFVICPLFIVTVIFLVLYLKQYDHVQDHCKNEKIIVFILICMSVSILFAYSPENVISSLHSDQASGPDMRYLSPAYIPVDFLALIILIRTGLLLKMNRDIPTIVFSSILFVPVVFILFLISSISLQNAGFGPMKYPWFFTVLVALCLSAFLLVCAKKIIVKKVSGYYGIIFSFLISIPLAFQLITLILVSSSKFNGYPFWIPIVEKVFSVLTLVRLT